MFQTRQQGTPLEMGRQLGLGLKQGGMRLGPPQPKALRFARRCEELVAQHAPELLEELRGLNEAGLLPVFTPSRPGLAPGRRG